MAGPWLGFDCQVRDQEPRCSGTSTRTDASEPARQSDGIGFDLGPFPPDQRHPSVASLRTRPLSPGPRSGLPGYARAIGRTPQSWRPTMARSASPSRLAGPPLSEHGGIRTAIRFGAGPLSPVVAPSGNTVLGGWVEPERTGRGPWRSSRVEPVPTTGSEAGARTSRARQQDPRRTGPGPGEGTAAEPVGSCGGTSGSGDGLDRCEPSPALSRVRRGQLATRRLAPGRRTSQRAAAPASRMGPAGPRLALKSRSEVVRGGVPIPRWLTGYGAVSRETSKGVEG